MQDLVTSTHSRAPSLVNSSRIRLTPARCSSALRSAIYTLSELYIALRQTYSRITGMTWP